MPCAGSIVNGHRCEADPGSGRMVATFTTSDAAPVDVVLASVPAGGDVEPVLDLYVFATWPGVENPEVVSIASGGLAINDVAGGGGVLWVPNFTAPATYGTSGVRPTIAVVASGTDIVVRCTGLVGVDVSWRVSRMPEE